MSVLCNWFAIVCDYGFCADCGAAALVAPPDGGALHSLFWKVCGRQRDRPDCTESPEGGAHQTLYKATTVAALCGWCAYRTCRAPTEDLQ